nr:hypothetical protein Iba_chr11fCG12150 [Ipomoea batatas]
MNGIGLTSRSDVRLPPLTDRRISHGSIPDSKSIKYFKGEKKGFFSINITKFNFVYFEQLDLLDQWFEFIRRWVK